MASKGLIIGIVVGVLVLGGGGVFGAAKMGIIKIPGLTPVKKKNNAMALYGDKGAKPVAKKDVEPPKKSEPEEPAKPIPKPTHKIDPEVGAQKVADLWSAMEPTKVAEIAKDWKDVELARVLALMDDAQSAAVLGSLEPSRASKVSVEIQKQASKVPIKEDS